MRFARAHGFPEENLLTERSRKIWLFWKENASQPTTTGSPIPRRSTTPTSSGSSRSTATSTSAPPERSTCRRAARAGQLGCCTTTSGLFFKLPGRVGDSPLVGAGLYCDGDVGSAGGTGHGESNIIVAGAHTVVEFMRHGQSPESACLATLERVVRNTKLDYLRDAKGRPKNNLLLYAVNRAGEVGERRDLGGRAQQVCGLPRRLRAAALRLRLPVQEDVTSGK